MHQAEPDQVFSVRLNAEWNGSIAAHPKTKQRFPVKPVAGSRLTIDRFPKVALDRLAHNSQFVLTHLEVVNTARTRLASDHLPLLGQFTTV